MTLAQVVYNISTDGDFAAHMRSDPNTALAQRGLSLSKEELAFLMTVLKRDVEDEFTRVVHLIDRAGGNWNR